MKKSLFEIEINKLKPYAKNPRINEESIEDVIYSIEKTDNLDPIEIETLFMINY